jgi:hypothetical protein
MGELQGNRENRGKSEIYPREIEIESRSQILRPDFELNVLSPHLFQGSIQKRFWASFRGIDRRLRKLRGNGEVSENAYFQESDFENNLFSAAKHRIRQKDLAKIRFPASCAGI